jgi:ABC-type glycerol-3-phosphate transport system substrate-binding protein
MVKFSTRSLRHSSGRRRLATGSVVAVALILSACGQESGTAAVASPASAAIAFVQVASAAPQTAQAAVAVKYAAAQGTGDLNVVVVGWNDTTATVTSVADSSGNV